MIEKNKPARNYEWRLKVDSASAFGSATGSYKSGELTVTYGNAYSAGSHGFDLTVVNYSDDPTLGGAAQHCDVTFTTPWGTYSHTFASTQKTAEFRVEMDAATLSGTCNTWALAFTALRLVYDPDVTNVTLWSVGSESQSGSSYDPRDNDDFWQARCAVLGPATPGPAKCPVDPASPPTYDWNLSYSMRCGFRYYESGAWVYPTLDVINPSAKSITCSCSTALPSVSEADSWTIDVPCSYRDQVTWTRRSDLDWTCTCWDGSATWTVNVYALARVTTQTYDDVRVHRRDGPIRNYRTVRTSSCTVDGSGTVVTDDITTTTDHTVCLTDPYGYYKAWTVFCPYAAGGITPDCPPPPSPGRIRRGRSSYTCTGSLPSATICEIILQAVMYWPVKPDCVDAFVRFDYEMQDEIGILHLAYVDASGNVHYKRSKTNTAATGWDVDVTVTSTADCTWVSFDQDVTLRRVSLYYGRADGTAYTRTSDDDGTTWNSESTFMASVGPVFTACDEQIGDMVIVWFVYNSGTSGPGTAWGKYRQVGEASYSSAFQFTSGGTPLAIADGGMCNVVADRSGQVYWTFAPILDGNTTPSVFVSADACRTWTLT